MIIKCPECGHQISDKAPVCPSCGVEIAGKIVRCPHCGEIHFISDGICPNCHHSLTERPGGKSEITDSSLHGNADAQIVSDGTEDPGTADTMDTLDEEEQVYEEEEQAVQAIPLTPTAKEATEYTEDVMAKPLSGQSSKAKSDNASGGKKVSDKKSRWPLVISILIALGICITLLFAYNHANEANEEREYRTAMDSRDPGILQSYLNTYVNAPEAHRDSVQALLNAIRASDPSWENIKNSSDANALRAYLNQNPNSPHKQEILNKIDELDWKAALQSHDFANYLSLHQNGIHAAEAVDSVKLTMDLPADDKDKQKAISAVRSFLIAINSHNDDRVMGCVTDHMDYFNEKSSVEGSEALNYMAIIYKNADRLNWHVDNADAAKVTKIGNGGSAAYSITMPARLSVNYNTGNNVQAKYSIQAKVNASGKIAAIKLIRLAEEASKGSSKSSEEKKADSKSSEKKTSEKKSSDKKSSSGKSISKKK